MDLIQILNFILLISSALVAGAAFYVSVVENPARNLGMAPQVRREAFIPTYKKAALIQVTSLFISLLTLGALFFLTWKTLWAIGCGLLLVVLVFTLVKILPLNHILIHPEKEYSDEKITELLNKWTKFQIFRTICCVSAFVLFTLATVGLNA